MLLEDCFNKDLLKVVDNLDNKAVKWVVNKEVKWVANKVVHKAVSLEVVKSLAVVKWEDNQELVLNSLAIINQHLTLVTQAVKVVKSLLLLLPLIQLRFNNSEINHHSKPNLSLVQTNINPNPSR